MKLARFWTAGIARRGICRAEGAGTSAVIHGSHAQLEMPRERLKQNSSISISASRLSGFRNTPRQRHQRHREDEHHPRAPARIDEPLEAQPRDVTGRRDLEDHQQRHHARDDPQHRRAGAQRLGVKHHRAAQHDLVGKRVERREQIGVVQPGRKGGPLRPWPAHTVFAFFSHAVNIQPFHPTSGLGKPFGR